MTDTAALEFDTRLRRILRQHRRMANGVRAVTRADGLVVPVPRRARPRLPLRALSLLVITAFVAKLAMFTVVGAEDYAARVAVLAGGNLAERAGAFLLQADPATIAVADWIAERLG